MAGFNKVLSKKNKRKTFFQNFIEITLRRAEDCSHEARKLYSPYLAEKLQKMPFFAQFFSRRDVLTYGLYLSRRLEDFLKFFSASVTSFSP